MTQTSATNAPSFDADGVITKAPVSSAPAADNSGWKKRLSRVDFDEFALAASLVMLSVFVRVLWLTPVEIWGDAGQKWHFARQLHYANDLRHGEWTHHMARFGVNLPVFFLQRLLGTTPKLYFVVPVAAYTLQVLFAYLVARRLGGRLAGVFSALFLIVFTGTIRSSSQLLPDGIAGTVLVLLAFLWLYFHDADGKARLYWLLAVCSCFVWAYAMKESNIFFFPALLACVWLSRRSYKEAAIFIGFVAAYGALETAGFALFTNYSSRLAIVEDAAEYQPITFVQLFDRYAKLEPPWQMLLWLWVPSAFWLLTKRDRAFRPMLIIPTTFILLLTFLVRHVDPIVPWIGSKSRYLAVIVPLMVVGIGLLVGEVSRTVWNAHRAPRLQSLVARLRSDSAAWVMVLCSALCALVYIGQGKPRFLALRQLHQQSSVLNDAYGRNLPIVDFSRDARALKTVYEIFLDDKLLSRFDGVHRGWLADTNAAVQKTGTRGSPVAYLLMTTAAYKPGDLEQLIANDCVVVVGARASVVDVVQKRRLPAACKAPSGEPLLP